MNKLIAYCGLDCEKCDARIATMGNDNVLREKTARLWSKLNKTKITADMIQCNGCRADGAKTPYCESLCPIRKCAMDKGYETCGDCSKLNGCQTAEMVLSNNADAVENLKK